MGKFEHGFGTQLGAVLLWRRVIFVGKFEHGFGTQLGAVLLWRRPPSGSLMQFGATRRQLQETKKPKKIDFF